MKMASNVHIIRYYKPKPRSINCVSYNKGSKQVAVAREDASIEIWDLSYAPYLVKFIPGVNNGSVEALGWVNERLLSTGLGGALLEWNLDTLCLKTTVLLTGYAAWCLDVTSTNTLVAVGTEQGYVNLYSVEGTDIVYKKLFDKQEGRIMCCKFDNTGNILVTGSVDTIRVWNVATGQAMSRMSARRRGQETIVWCLSVLTDNTVVSGDSHGRLTYWDISTGDQIESFTTHKSDILSIVVNDEEKSLYCSGVDPIIVNFVKVDHNKKGGQCQWVKNVQRHIHEHDVRGLALQGDKLLSVGVDGYMTFSSYPPKWVMRIPPMLPSARSAVSEHKKLILLKYSNHLEVWKLGSYATDESGKPMMSNVNIKVQHQSKKNANSKSLELDSAVASIKKANLDKVKLQSLKLTENTLKLVSVQTKGKKQVKCCALSPDGEFIVYSTDSHIRMLKLGMDDDGSTASLSKVLISGLSASTCDRVCFTADSRGVVLHCGGQLCVLQVDAEAGAALVQTLDATKYLKSSTLLHLQVSKPAPSGRTYLAAAVTTGAIEVWAHTGRKYKHHASLPRYHCVPSALLVDHVNERIIVVYVDQKIVDYDLVGRKVSDWPSRQLPPEWYSRRVAVRAVCAHPQRPATLIFHDENSLWILDKADSENTQPPAKKSSKTESGNLSLRIVPIKYLSEFHWLSADEAAIVELLPEAIVGQLPPVVQIKRPPYIA